MFYVGIDIAKQKHSAAVINNSGEILLDRFTFDNTKNGFRSLTKTLSSVGARPARCTVCLESTGHYGANLKAYLLEHHYKVYEVNPILTDNWRKSSSMRSAKTDAIDSLALATWIKSSKPVRPVSERNPYADLRTLSRTRSSLIATSTLLRNKVLAILDIVFPEHGRFFNKPFSKTFVAVLCLWPSAEKIAHARIDTLAKLMASTSKSHYKKQDCQRLKALAKDSVGQASDMLEFQLRMFLDHFKYVRSQISQIEARLEDLMDDSPILTVPGIGFINGAGILGELGDINRFANASKVIAYAGCDPTVYASGQTENAKAHMSCRGSVHLRRHLWYAAGVARLFDPALKACYQRKRAQGKPYQVAMTCVVHKLCRIIYAVLRDNKPYECRV